MNKHMPATYRVLFASLLLAGLLFGACTPPSSVPSPTATPAAKPSGQSLNFYNWDTYIDPAILTGFEARYGATINYTTYANNEELMATLRSEPGKYDLVVPTHYVVAGMLQAGLLMPLDKANIPNLANIAPDFRNPNFDSDNRYCAPYLWGTMGIGYNARATGKEIQTIADFFDPAFAGRIALLDDPRPTLGFVLMHLGYSPNTTSATEINAARDFLIAHADQIAAYAPDTGQDLLAAGEVDLVYEWSGDIYQVMAEYPNIRYVIPEEGSLLWNDNLCIPAGAPHKALAEQFINYILEPETGAALANFTRFASPNQAAVPLIDAIDRDNPALYPPPEVRNRLTYIADLDADTALLYDRAWAAVKEAAR